MKNIYLAFLHFLWLSHKDLTNIFKDCDYSFYKEFYENLSSFSLKKYWIRDSKILHILSKKREIDEEKIINSLEKVWAEIISINDREYPEELANLHSPPFLIYVRWTIPKWEKFGIVWSRKMTSYWEDAIKKFTPSLLDEFIIVSWWAIWCDTIAHISTLENSWKTIVCSWTWIDVDYPASNSQLYREIADWNWAIVWVFPVWSPPSPKNFPIRNEIISAFSKWIWIVEAREKSWSLITWRLALEMWKDLFAMPWDAFSKEYLWTNLLIAKGEAYPVLSAESILNVYWKIDPYTLKKSIDFANEKEFKRHIKKQKKENPEILIEKKKKPKFDEKIDEDIYDILIKEPQTPDFISKTLNIEITQISYKLTMLEISWIVKKWIWGFYEV